jgi:hypothetical protein
VVLLSASTAVPLLSLVAVTALLLTRSLAEYFLPISRLGEQVGEVVKFIPKRDLDRSRLIQEARAIYERIFPAEKAPASLPQGSKEPYVPN